MNLRDVLARIDGLLKRCGIEYAVIGGYAVAAWGEVRATRDIDLSLIRQLCPEPHKPILERLVKPEATHP